MSSDSLAIFRKSMGSDLGALAEEHYRHDLNENDRQKLQSAASTVSTYATIGSVVGLGLGVFLAYRLRANRTAMFQAFKAAEKPVEVRFANGRTEPIPDLTRFMQPSTLGDLATYTFFAGGGLFFGGELGLLGGGMAANSTITRDPESKARIEGAFRKFRAEVLRKEAEMVERGEKNPMGM
ncbi:hypothetical protein MBLNU457_3317t1 [Dothideomycetes sp. NU457]